MSATGRSGRAARANPARPPASFWAAAEAARREGLLSYGALEYLRALARLARARGDGRTFTLGERVIEDITGLHRTSIQRWRVKLERLGFIRFERQWAHKRGWFWEARTTLVFDIATGHKMWPVYRPQNVASGTGHKKWPSLYRDQPKVKDKVQRAARATQRKEEGSGLRPAPKSGTGTPPPNQSAPVATNDGKTPPSPTSPPPNHQPDWEHLAETWRRLTAKLRDVPPPDDPASCPSPS